MQQPQDLDNNRKSAEDLENSFPEASKESHQHPSAGTESPSSINKWEGFEDPDLVSWDGPDDPKNPLNWSTWAKTVNILLVSAVCFLTPLASSMFAPGVPELMREFGNTKTELGIFVVSVYVLGFAFGPIFLAPLSETYGRQPIYHIGNVFFVAFSIACAVSPNIDVLICMRFMEGIFGSAPLTYGGGSIADLVSQEKRGRAMTLYVLGPLLGPVVGPIAGGYLTQARGWRAVFWLLSITGSALTILCFLFMRETCPAVILRRKAL